MLDSLYQLGSAPNTNASTDLPTSQCVSQHFRSVHFTVAAESPLSTCEFSHYLIKPSTLLQMMKTGSYSDPLRVTLTARETSSMPAMWMYAALHCVCMHYVYILCVCFTLYISCVCVCVFYSAYNLQGYKCRNKFIAAQGKIRPTLHYRDVHYSDLLLQVLCLRH